MKRKPKTRALTVEDYRQLIKLHGHNDRSREYFQAALDGARAVERDRMRKAGVHGALRNTPLGRRLGNP